MTRSMVPAHHDEFESIVIFADGEPLVLELSGWTPDAIGASESAYRTPATSSTDAFYHATIDQIRLIAEADDIRLQTTGSLPKEFGLWGKQKSARNDLTEFLDRALLRDSPARSSR